MDVLEAIYTRRSIRKFLDTPVEFDKVMLVGDGDSLAIGQPYVQGGRVTAEVLEHGKGDKVLVLKFRRRKDYKRVKSRRPAETPSRWLTRKQAAAPATAAIQNPSASA